MANSFKPKLFCLPVLNELEDRSKTLPGGEVKKFCEHVCVFSLAADVGGIFFDEKLWDGSRACVDSCQEKDGVVNWNVSRAECYLMNAW